MSLLTSGNSEASTKALAEISESQKEMIRLSEHFNKKSLVQMQQESALMKAAGQVGLNKPYRAPIYQTYKECVTGLYR